MRITYCPALPEDADVLYGLCKQLIDDYEDTASIEYDKVLAWVKGKIERTIGAYTRVLADGSLAGWYCLDKDSGELDDFYILPAFRGKGIGTRVLETCIAESEKPVWLYVFRKNVRAIALYRRMGFTIREEVGTTRYIMER